jgi:hypothetical protein
MDRKDFLQRTLQAAIVFTSTPLLAQWENLQSLVPRQEDFRQESLAPIEAKLFNDFMALIDWLKKNGWEKYLKDTTGLDLSKVNTNNQDELFSELKQPRPEGKGFDDFAGVRAIEPGQPAFSLLYHALASPLVQPDGFDKSQYPSLEQIDRLEDYIYGLKNFDLSLEVLKRDYALAVFAYEYRPAFKTPHHRHADLVFSRTGVARIGEESMHYDEPNRCFTNCPIDPAHIQKIAVMPARYGLFLSKIVKVSAKEIVLAGENKLQDPELYFLLPVRKLFNDDILINTQPVVFQEHHIAEKLKGLVTDPRYKLNVDGSHQFDFDAYPFLMESRTVSTEESPASQLVIIKKNSSSALLIPTKQSLIKPAIQDNRYIKVEVPEGSESNNRYFTTYNSLGMVEGIEILTGQTEKTRTTNLLNRPRNTPLYLNIRHQLNGENPPFAHLNEQQEINDKHMAVLFVDHLCDGSIWIDTRKWNSAHLPMELFNCCLPAFSIVTAPDFFPLVDNFDLLCYDIDTISNTGQESHFYEGGLSSLSSSRIKPNPHTLSFPNSIALERQKLAYTYTSVLSSLNNTPISIPAERQILFRQTHLRQNKSTSFLPDTCSFVFAPGWDVTYGNDGSFNTSRDRQQNSYLSTRGLGSPFPEDMKLCAAMNGMWPVSSPDAARTFQGSLYEDARNPTAIPLLDIEIGIHKDSPYNDLIPEGSEPYESFGWDGEQGPFLALGKGSFVVNFTDIRRADYVANLLNTNGPGFNMSRLRNLTAAELIFRMECLRQCIKHIDKDNIVAYTDKWLVSAESVQWNTGASGHGVPRNLTGTNSKTWATKARPGITDDGFLYIFVKAKNDKKIDWVTNDRNCKRRRQFLHFIDVCQVADGNLSYCTLNGKGRIIENWKDSQWK